MTKKNIAALCFFINLVFPAMGLILVQKFIIAAITLLVISLYILAVFWSRYIFEPDSYFLILCIGLIMHIGFSAFCFAAKSRAYSITRKFMYGLLLYLVIVFFWSLFYFQQSRVLGVQIYFVPSQSMYPTLNAGDFILADTWGYKNSTPKTGDIIIFRLPGSRLNMVKRVSEWPDQMEPPPNNPIFVRGDNAQLSHDSRSFGGISIKAISGQIKLIVYSMSLEKILLKKL